MRANQSFTASGNQSCIGVSSSHLQTHAPTPRLPALRGQCGRSTGSSGSLAAKPNQARFDSAKVRGEGLLHDARNLVGTIGLYCDLLSMPGVLKPEHRQYPEELRHLGARSKSMIDHLMQSLFALENSAAFPTAALGSELMNSTSVEGIENGGTGAGRKDGLVSLRSVVERCSGLLNRVANGRQVEIIYGPAAAVSVRVPEESLERILVNLVRNAATAMNANLSTGARSAAADSPDTTKRDSIRIVVGPTVSRVGEHKPWPFQRVRLVVEDTGCGMSRQRQELLLRATTAKSRGGHGIGFRVVRDLVAASEGEIGVMSEPGTGTRVQIEWPVKGMQMTENSKGSLSRCSSSPSVVPIAVGSGVPQPMLAIVRRDVRMMGKH